MDTTTGRNPSKEYPYFDEDISVDLVNARMDGQADPRLKEVMSVVVKHLHAAVKEIQPTHEEWLAAIGFLTRVGQMCTEWRQEYILLSDTLGVSMLVDAINHRRPSGATENTILGPFYVPNAPRYPHGANICLDGKGEPLLVRGRVIDTDGNVVEGAMIDVWQTNEDGFYDVQQKDLQPDFNLRGVFISDYDGSYSFRSVKPRFYPIPNDGPVGKLLGSLGRHPNRAAHIHVIVTAPGFDPVITHIFSPDCPYLAEDAVFGVKKTLIADFNKVDDPAAIASNEFDGPYWMVEWDFTLAKEVTATSIIKTGPPRSG